MNRSLTLGTYYRGLANELGYQPPELRLVTLLRDEVSNNNNFEVGEGCEVSDREFTDR